ncbi:MAG: DUF2911 domain-containing protein [Bacteroidota bacterium]
MLRAFLSAVLLLSLPGLLLAQHAGHGGSDGGDRHQETVRVDGLRIDLENPPPGSSVGRSMAFVQDSYLQVIYGRPIKRGRIIFGGLVGYDQVWAMGAHYATELIVTEPVLFGGERLDAGVYSLSALPTPEAWTIHVNRVLGMHLADLYDPANNVLAVTVPVEPQDEVTERLTIEFEAAEDGVDLHVAWDQVRVQVPVRPFR